jgi:hypothetical protein
MVEALINRIKSSFHILKTVRHVFKKEHQLLMALFLRLLMPFFGRWFFPNSLL